MSIPNAMIAKISTATPEACCDRQPTPCRPGRRPVRAASARRVDTRACALARLRAGVRRGSGRGRRHLHHRGPADRFGPGVAAALSSAPPRVVRASVGSRWPRRPRELPRHAGERVLKASALIAARTCVASAAPTRVLRDLTARPTPIQLRILVRALRTRSCNGIGRSSSRSTRAERAVARATLSRSRWAGPYGVVHGVLGIADKRTPA